MIFLVALNLFATMILNLNVKESPKRVDLFLNFDVPFEGVIAQSKSKEKVTLLLKDVKILTKWQRKLTSPLAYQIEVYPTPQGTAVAFYTVDKYRPKLVALRSRDGFSLKISLIAQMQPQNKSTSHRIFTLPQWSYWVLLAIIALFLLIFILRSLPSKPRKTKRVVIMNNPDEEFHVLFEKPLDEHNKAALISFKGIDYLVIIGTSNLLLGKFREGEIQSEEDFHQALQEHHSAQKDSEELTPMQEELLTTIEEYKKKASGNI